MIKTRLFAALLPISLFLSNGMSLSVVAQDNTNKIEEPSIEAYDTSDDTPYESYANNYIDTGYRIDSYSNGQSTLYQNSSLPSRYDSRNYGYITSVKNQKNDGTCWAFSALGAGEATLIKNGYYNRSNIDLSELQLAYFFYNRSIDPLDNISNDYVTIENSENFLSIGGNNYFTLFALSSWKGAVDESLVPYGNASPSMTLNNKYAYESDKVHLQNSYIVSMEISDEVKRMIMNYGAVSSAMYNLSTYYNKVDNSNWAYCQKRTTTSNHGIMIIGWDDNYSVDKFSTLCKPDNPGAWLVKNSWGEGNTDYIWISYEDVCLSGQDAFVYIFDNADNYDFNYQYDGGYSHQVLTVENGYGLSNIYTVKGSDVEELKAVSIALAEDKIRYEIQVYYNPDSDNPLSGTPVFIKPQTGTTSYAGYHTIKLNTPVLLSKGDRFSVVVTFYDDYDGKVGVFVDGDGYNGPLKFDSYAEPGQSYYVIESDDDFVDLYDRGKDNCARIKAFTDKASAVNIADCNISAIDDQNYTGAAVKPIPVITYNGITLNNGTDFTLSYSNNTSIGTAEVTITGKGRFNGTKKVNFIIDVKNYETVYAGVDYSAVYNYNYYITKYSDLQRAFGADTSKALAHFVNSGMREGRQASEDFNVIYYKNRYPDLRNVFGTDLKKYYLHYINNGKKEGRDAKTVCAIPKGASNNTSTGVTRLNGVDYSAVYNYNYYIDKYPDLKNAFGSDDTRALQHFVNNGMGEGRQASEDFNVTYYRNRYADLRGAFGTNLKGYYLHYLSSGKNESRDAKTACSLQGGITVLNGIDYSAVYDFNYYISKYPDIKIAFGNDDLKALQHFVNNGMREGRVGKADFIVSYYKNAYPDLRKAYGNNLKLYYLHYINSGKKEKRIANADMGLVGATTVYNGIDYGAVYDYNYYINKYPDIKKAYGGDENAVLAHFVNSGMKEGRQADKAFNVKYYMDNYKDLQKIYGNNLTSYYMHYINNGKKEGRIADKLIGK